MFDHVRLCVLLIALLLIPALGCRSTRHKDPLPEYAPAQQATSSGCSQCG